MIQSLFYNPDAFLCNTSIAIAAGKLYNQQQQYEMNLHIPAFKLD
jgi:hypothetical protein